ncbi:hypothetical protein JW872_01935 [Candidatus Babeliales bacterium]|nr:hypothetical protein [Candidatus Babeliales bacterium]
MGPNEAKSYGSHVALGMVLIILTACGLAWKTETDAIKRLSPNNVDDIVRRYRIARRRELNIGNEALPATTGFLNHHA